LPLHHEPIVACRLNYLVSVKQRCKDLRLGCFQIVSNLKLLRIGKHEMPLKPLHAQFRFICRSCIAYNLSKAFAQLHQLDADLVHSFVRDIGEGIVTLAFSRLPAPAD
jgi:hypothetical protein